MTSAEKHCPLRVDANHHLKRPTHQEGWILPPPPLPRTGPAFLPFCQLVLPTLNCSRSEWPFWGSSELYSSKQVVQDHPTFGKFPRGRRESFVIPTGLVSPAGERRRRSSGSPSAMSSCFSAQRWLSTYPV